MSLEGINDDEGGRRLELNGASIYYEDRGDGPAVILIHGGLGAGSEWRPIASLLDGEFRVITPDSRGHGRSTNPVGKLSYGGIADDIAALIEVLGLQRPLVGGWSDGGQVAMELAARHPTLAGALIVGAAYPDFDAGGLREAHRALLGADDDGVPDLAYLDAQLGEWAAEVKKLHRGGELHWQTLIEQTAKMWLGYEGLDQGELQAIQTPTLVLAGDRDELIPLELSVRLYQTLPDTELAVVPSLGHEGPSSARGAFLAEVIRDFARRRL
ncbi:alpha/beta hydrolase [Arthrobacter sp. R1-13]